MALKDVGFDEVVGELFGEHFAAFFDLVFEEFEDVVVDEAFFDFVFVVDADVGGDGAGELGGFFGAVDLLGHGGIAPG